MRKPVRAVGAPWSGLHSLVLRGLYYFCVLRGQLQRRNKCPGLEFRGSFLWLLQQMTTNLVA